MTRLRNGQVRILHVVGGMNRAGIETWLMRILRGIDRSRYRMDFLVHTTQPCAYDDEIKALGSRIIPCTDTAHPWRYAREFKQVLRDCGPYDVVHSQQYLLSGFILRLADQAGVPVRIAHMHPLKDVDNNRPGRWLYRRVMTRWLSRHANCIMAPSRSSLESFLSICDCRGKLTSIVPNCIELSSFADEIDRVSIRQNYGLPPDKPVVTYVARFVPHKNHNQVLRVADRINSRGIKAHFVMAGSHGECLQDVQRQAGKREDVSVLTDIENISKLLFASDVFFFPSLEEGFGVVAIEAAAAGLPVVATDLPSIREACAPSHCRFMFPPNDDEAAEKSLLEILNNSELRQQLSADAKQWAGKFSVERSINELVSVYDSCISRCRLEQGGKALLC